MDPVRRPNAATVVADRIRDYIVEVGLGPGDPLPTEAVLCDELGVSRSSVREALRRLDALDFVEVRHGSGSFVGEVSLKPLVESVSFRGLIDRRSAAETLRDIVEVRRALDLGHAELVVDALTGTRQDRLRSLVTSMVERAGRGEHFPDEDRAFHAELLRGASPNLLAENLLSAFWDIHTTLVGDFEMSPPKDIALTAAAHGAMLDTAVAGDLEGYREAVKQHYAPLLRALGGAAPDHAVR
ncbi:GntR family transcriptional regulator [Brachybacterium sp. NBEC-018]|uniref:FadR/GntR family transcriptional regulator n=1 Tax=Brachybacterium sp. NBEC-018 TaxID=2996004 RepID=UPI0021752D1F|nr:GntR family transcriptional regulator [Brachybacterium sp. NBEC-018]UVY82992.1 GntR family transcriptional regulator [Brachybacterium sp. NBEC-018]